MMCGGSAAALLSGFVNVNDCKPLPRQIRTVRAEDRLPARMQMVLSTHGTCSLGTKLWAVVPPIYLLFKNTLPDFVPRFHSCPRVGSLGALSAVNIGGRPANSSFSEATLELGPSLSCGPWVSIQHSVRPWVVGPECRLSHPTPG